MDACRAGVPELTSASQAWCGADRIGKTLSVVFAALCLILALGPAAAAAQSLASGFAGTPACAACHAAESELWAGSHHARAMQAASPTTILGNFADATLEHFGATARFFRRGDAFFIATEDRDGKPAEFKIAYTFGLYPLQQYLTMFADGRLQALPFAWDTRPTEKGGQRWFHLYPDQPMPHTDPLHWTGPQQNWNFMCADCHSTAVKKGYDPATDRFDTRFSAVNVGCEACHGAGQAHIDWANSGKPATIANKGFASAVARRPTPDWSIDPQTGSPMHGVARPVGDEVEACSRCHARRSQFSDGWLPGDPLTKAYLPSFLSSDLFEDDGQMRDEVFNYSSFQQSKMFAKGVICSDCHDPHSSALKAKGSDVCAQCHQPEKFNSLAHTGHPPSPTAPDCIACHMSVRTYMVVHPRHDHSFRIPRPDLSVALGVPNACNDCHKDRDAAWAAAAIEAWHGPVRKGYQTYAAAFHAERTHQPQAGALLLAVANGNEVPPIARATALVELGGHPSVETDRALAHALTDPDPMVRIAGLRGLAPLPRDQRWRRANSLLGDPIAAVRIEAAQLLADQPPGEVNASERARLEAAFAEYEAAQRFIADRPEGYANLGSFLARRGRIAEAEAEYLAGIARSPSAVALHVDLADLYRQTRREPQAEQVLRSAISVAPGAAAPHYALGLSLIRTKRLDEAMGQLQRAAELDPDNARFAYVYGVALQSRGRLDEARKVWESALARDPTDPDILTALLEESLRAQDLDRARAFAERLSPLRPDDAALARLAAQLRNGKP
jgi:predicted CXXCH cytochrome family protein